MYLFNIAELVAKMNQLRTEVDELKGKFEDLIRFMHAGTQGELPCCFIISIVVIDRLLSDNDLVRIIFYFISNIQGLVVWVYEYEKVH